MEARAVPLEGDFLGRAIPYVGGVGIKPRQEVAEHSSRVAKGGCWQNSSRWPSWLGYCQVGGRGSKGSDCGDGDVGGMVSGETLSIWYLG